MNDKITEDIKIIRESQIRMESDIKYHIKRTDFLEATQIGFSRDVKDLHKVVNNLKRGASFKDLAQIGAWIAAIAVGAITLMRELFK